VRPRQIYLGSGERKFVPMALRPDSPAPMAPASQGL